MHIATINSCHPKAKHYGKIAVDMDDVIVDYCGGVRAAVELEYGITLPEFTEYKLGSILDPVVGRPWFEWMQDRDWIWKTFPAIPGAIGGIEALRKMGYRIEIVTHKPEWAEATTWQWLGRWRPMAHSVVLVDPEDKKSDHTNAQLLIDDKYENVLDFRRAGRDAILFDRPHNKKVRLPGVARAHNWAEVIKIVRDYNG